MFAAGAMTINFMTSFRVRSEAQSAMDSAVLAGTLPPDGTPEAERLSLADASFNANRRLKSTVKKETTEYEVIEPTSSVFTVSGTSVSGRSVLEVPNPFKKILGSATLTVTVEAEAQKMQAGPICVLGLDPSEAETIDINGNAEVNLTNCTALANSKSGEGMRQVGTSWMKAKAIGVTGGYTGDNFMPVPITGADPKPDPLASIPMPKAGACVADVPKKLQQTTVTLDPGTYCGGLDIKADSHITLKPGIYIMLNGPLMVNSGATLTGNNVMIAFLGPDATAYIQAGAVVTLTSPLEGTYAGIQFFGDRETYSSKSGKVEPLWFTVIGDSTVSWDGTLYMPAHHTWLAGGSAITATSPNYVAISRKLWFQDNTRISFTQSNPRGLPAAPPGQLTYGARVVR
jgi:hypothetical protein